MLEGDLFCTWREDDHKYEKGFGQFLGRQEKLEFYSQKPFLFFSILPTSYPLLPQFQHNPAVAREEEATGWKQEIGEAKAIGRGVGSGLLRRGGRGWL